MRTHLFATAIRLFLGITGLVHGPALCAQSLADAAAPDRAATAWFGLTLPPAFEPHTAPVIVGGRAPEPVRLAAGEPRDPALTGAAIKQDLAAIVGFAVASREQREIGNGQLWGRISGFSSGAATVDWAAEQLRNAGIEDVQVQPFSQEAGASLWLPLAWQVKLLGSDRFGTGSHDVVLETAMPLAPSVLPESGITAPVVYVGTASAAELTHIDVAGRIAIQHVRPQAHMVFERAPTVARARRLFERGALAVINVVDLPGNERARDFSRCGGPCFNLGGRDGWFLEAVVEHAAAANLANELQLQIDLSTKSYSGLTAQNAVAVIPGKGPTPLQAQTIVVNAHTDAWFDGAGDNGDGLAVMIALARHFAKADNQLQRTLVFVASAGHHSAGLHGPRNFVAMNRQLADRAVLALNIEHVAQRNISPARSHFADGYRQYMADAGEAPIVSGVSNGAPFLTQLFDQGVIRYGTNFVSGNSTMSSGEGSGYRDLGIAVVTTMQAPPLYHTSGEVIEMISEPGLERMARFLAYFLKAVDGANAEQINPPSTSG